MLTKEQVADITETLHIIGFKNVYPTSVFWNGIALKMLSQGYVTVKDVKYYAKRYIVNTGIAGVRELKEDVRCE